MSSILGVSDTNVQTCTCVPKRQARAAEFKGKVWLNSNMKDHPSFVEVCAPACRPASCAKHVSVLSASCYGVHLNMQCPGFALQIITSVYLNSAILNLNSSSSNGHGKVSVALGVTSMCDMDTRYNMSQ
eukprot:1191094-Prorocentrum_minimum.AAC.1